MKDRLGLAKGLGVGGAAGVAERQAMNSVEAEERGRRKRKKQKKGGMLRCLVHQVGRKVA